MEQRAERERCLGIVAAEDTVVCRLTASVEAMKQPARIRQSWLLQPTYVARVAVLNAILDRAGLEDFSENRSLSEIAQEMLFKAGWISDRLPRQCRR